MTERWTRQKREVDSYNVFFNAFKGYDPNESLHNLGYRLIGTFVEVVDRGGVRAEPDFVLYNDETLLLAEIKSGTNINGSDIDQMDRTASISIESAIDWLRDADMTASGYDPNNLNNIEPAIVYYNDFMEECRTSSGCSNALDELAEHTAVLSQQKGGELILEEGDVSDANLRNRLTDGIPIPVAVDKAVYLTENIEREILAFSIVHDTVLNSIGKDNELAIKPEDIVERYRHRNVSVGKINDALEFLRQTGACVKIGDEFVFRYSNISTMMEVTEVLDDYTLRDYLTESNYDPGQTTLGSHGLDVDADDDD